jgi:multicomponent K+:H+ antiporter subunit A
LTLLKAFTLLLCVAASLASVALPRDLFAIIALGASGLAVALLFCLEPAPDVALVMVVVDILSTVILILSLLKLPARYRARVTRADSVNEASARRRTIDACIALGCGTVVALICLETLSRGTTGAIGGTQAEVSRTTLLTPYYEAVSQPLTGARDIVGAIVVDFRGFDTLIEITVFSLAGMGIYTLLRFASPHAGDRPDPDAGPDLAGPLRHPLLPSHLRGIAAPVTSPLLRALAWVLLPVTLMFAATQMMFGHIGPGDGFTAGVTASLGISFFYVIMGLGPTRRTLRWLRPAGFVGAGLLLAFFAQWLAGMLGARHHFFEPFDFGHALHLDGLLPPEFHFSSAFVFELSICLTVLGSSTLMIDTLARVEAPDPEAAANLSSIEALEESGVLTQPTDVSSVPPAAS